MRFGGRRHARERSSARTQQALLQRLRDEWDHAAEEERELQMAMTALARERAELAVRQPSTPRAGCVWRCAGDNDL